jgi:uncharacterized protein with PIN domain
MLKGIGRWLRAAGYDTAIARAGALDENLLAQARSEERVLLTCDCALARCSQPGGAVLLSTETLAKRAIGQAGRDPARRRRRAGAPSITSAGGEPR